MDEKNLQPNQPGVGKKLYRIVQTIFRILLGAFLFFAGITHLTVARTEFLAQVPTWLPVDGGMIQHGSTSFPDFLGNYNVQPKRRKAYKPGAHS